MERSFSQTMSALRKQRKLNQRKVAADLNISQALLSHYETGAREPGLDFVCRACRYYGVSADYLLGLSDNPGGIDSVVGALADLTAELDAVSARARASLEELKK